MTAWKRGMLAVCVDARDYGGRGPYGRHPVPPVLGGVYRVVRVTAVGIWVGDTRHEGLVVAGLRSANPEGDFCAIRFRPAVEGKSEDDADLIAKIKACKKTPTLSPKRHERAGYRG